LNGKVQKHQNFEQELNANKSRMEEITSTGHTLIESKHYALSKKVLFLQKIFLFKRYPLIFRSYSIKNG